MKLPTLLLLLLIFLLAAFTALNWGVFVQPAELSFGVATLQLPFGLLMLGLLLLRAWPSGAMAGRFSSA